MKLSYCSAVAHSGASCPLSICLRGSQAFSPCPAKLPSPIAYTLGPLAPFETDKLSVPPPFLSTLTSYLWAMMPLLFIVLSKRIMVEDLGFRARERWATEPLNIDRQQRNFSTVGEGAGSPTRCVQVSGLFQSSSLL